MTDSTAPVFIGGAGRSGTTLFVDLLGLHPRLAPIYETDFVIQLIDLLYSGKDLPPDQAAAAVIRCMDAWSKPLPHRPHNKRAHERYHHGPHYVLFDRAFAMERSKELAQAVAQGRVDDGFRDFLTALYAEHCRLDGKPRWVNKTPAYVHHLPLLLRLFPEMRFIHCIRDGRDVACSVLSRPWGPKTHADAADWWRTKVQDGVAFGKDHPERCLEVRYEDLVRDAPATISRLLGWIGEDPDPEPILRHYQGGVVTLDEGRIGEWQRTFAPADHVAFRERSGELLDHFGYT